MSKLTVCILFGGISPEHEVSLRSAESVLNNIDKEKYRVLPVGITRDGKWIYFGDTDYAMLPAGTWTSAPGSCPAAISPVRGQGENLAFQVVVVLEAVIAPGGIEHPVSDVDQIQQTAELFRSQFDVHGVPPSC